LSTFDILRGAQGHAWMREKDRGEVAAARCRASMAHMRQSRPDSGGCYIQNLLRCSVFARKRLGIGLGSDLDDREGDLARHGGQVAATRCRASMAHVRQSRPDSGQVDIFKTFKGAPSSLGSGYE